jgi:hypothetical protein
MTNQSILVFFSLLLYFITPTDVAAQKEHTSTGTFDLMVPPTMSVAEAQAYACDRARDSAVLQVFPQKLTTEIQTWIAKGKVSTNAFSTTELIGEWLGDVKEPAISVLSQDPFIIRCKVKGKVREKLTNSAELSVKTMYCPALSCEIEQFNEGQSLFLRIASSRTGYISVFLDNMDEAFQLLPYVQERKAGVNQVFLEQNKAYTFFSKEDAPESQRHLVNELELFAEQPGVELISLVVLFSEEPFNSPLMEQTEAGTYFDDSEYIGYTMPDAASSVEFNKWLLWLRQTNPGLQAVREMITVKR